jgi:acyl dehydratase
MPIDYHKLKNWQFKDVEHCYTEKDTMLYALGLGFGMDPLDEQQLRFVYEKNLCTLPTMAVVLGFPGFWMKDPETGIDWLKLLHGEQRLRVHKPLPPAGTVIGRSRVKSITDKGVQKGAVIVVERTVSDVSSGDLLATVEQVTFCRGDGGYSTQGSVAQPSDVIDTPAVAMPERTPDAVCEMPTRPEAALIYRLSADPNPLHAEPEVAREAGFARPILHGLATYGVAAHAIVKTVCDYHPDRLQALNVRFSSPVFPGETIKMEMWREGKHVLYRASVIERGVMVLNNGYAEIAN